MFLEFRFFLLRIIGWVEFLCIVFGCFFWCWIVMVMRFLFSVRKVFWSVLFGVLFCCDFRFCSLVVKWKLKFLWRYLVIFDFLFDKVWLLKRLRSILVLEELNFGIIRLIVDKCLFLFSVFVILYGRCFVSELDVCMWWFLFWLGILGCVMVRFIKFKMWRLSSWLKFVYCFLLWVFGLLGFCYFCCLILRCLLLERFRYWSLGLRF